MENSTELFRTAVAVVEYIKSKGYAAYFAGGCVRDMLMTISPSDYDIATNAKPDEITKIFRRSIPIGAKFGVVNVIVEKFQFEVATFRTDGFYCDGRRPDTVNFCDAKGDVQRRDFTINGMLYDPTENKLLDFVGGKNDIDLHLIRAIGNPLERFNEDHLRLIRAVRFASRFSYDIEPNTKSAIKKLAKKITKVSTERISEELEKGLTSPNPHIFIKMLDDLTLVDEIIPELGRMKGVEQPKNFHPEGDVFVHTLLTISYLDNPSWELALGTLLHDIAKPVTFIKEFNSNGEVERIKFYNHDNLGAHMAGKICKRLKTSTFTRERVMWLVKKHLSIKDVQNMRKCTIKKLFADPGFSELLELFRIDTLASTKNMTDYEYCVKASSEIDEDEIKPKPLVNGHDLIAMGLKPGPIFSQILSRIMDEQLEEKLSKRDEALDFAKRIIADHF